MDTERLAEIPNIFRFHDYREFLQAWLKYQKSLKKGFSLRSFCAEVGVSPAYLSMMLSGKRPLTDRALEKMIPALKLTGPQGNYLKQLRTIGESSSQAERLGALKRIRKFRYYRKLNPNEVEVHRYLTRWYYVAIREMTGLPEFRADAKWIQSHLKKHVPLGEIEEALKFLHEQGYIKLLPDGRAEHPDKSLNCVGGVFRIAMREYHEQMLGLAVDSLENMTAEERDMTSYTVAVPKADFLKIKAIMDEAINRVEQLGKNANAKDCDSVYHIGFFTFPLADDPKKRGGN
ncbi:MAG: TIGR02147 family protein [Bacteriovoracia bacterium]